MKRRSILYSVLIFSGILLMSIYEPVSFIIEFKTGNLDSDLLALNDSQSVFNQGRSCIEIVWNTGDTGAAIVIDTPGVYIVSVRDVWSIKGASGVMPIDTTYIMKNVFLKGYPDTVIVDTLIMNEVVSQPNWRTIHNYTLINKHGLYQKTYRDTSWTDGVKSYITESHPAYLGFWSGKLDTIVITQEQLPLIVGSNVLISKNKIVTKKVWSASY